MFEELIKVIEEFGKDKGIERDIVIDALETAMQNAAKKKIGPHVDIEAEYNSETNEIEVFQFKTVVEDGDVADEDLEIELKEAKKDDPDIELGDSLGIKLDAKIFGRIAAQTAKQVINQKIRDAEKEIIYSEFLKRKGEIISGIVRRFERGTVVVDLGKTEGYMPIKEQIPGEQYRVGDRVQAFLLDVLQTSRGPQIVLSRATPLYLIKLFEMEVPEIYEGIVTIKSAARNPGSRAKISVSSKDPDVDPVGACVGMRGSRVQNIVSELKGERIDIIEYKDDIARYACAALAPAEVSKVLIDEDNHYMKVVVPDAQLSLAIGRGGQNVRLAAQLTGWKIDVMSETDMSKKYDDAKFSLVQIPVVNETLATALYQNGYQNVSQVAEANIDEIKLVPGFENDSTAANLIKEAKELIASGNIVEREKQSFESTVTAKSAEDLLKEEMRQLLEKERQNLEPTSELLRVKGIGPSFLSLLNEKGINKLEDLINKGKEELLNTIDWDKGEIATIFDNASVMYNEKLIDDGKKEIMPESEQEKLKKIPEVTRYIIVRLSALGFMNIEDIALLNEDEFIEKLAIDETKAKAIYEGIKKLL